MKKFLTLTFITVMLSVASYAITPITGPHTVCLGSSTYLADSLSPGGVWTSSNIAIATVGSSTGIVNGVSAGVCDITYTTGSGYATITMTVSPSPTAISGPGTVCVGSSITLTDATPGGTWSGGSHETVGASTGVVTGVSGGWDYIYYTLPGGCSAYTTVTVGASPAGVITGPSVVCVGSTITLHDSLGLGGTWSSGTTSIATVTSGGVVLGVSAGTVVISYTTTGSCGTSYATRTITVGGTTSPGTISGPTTVVAGSTITLSETASGTWSSGTTSVATISGGGVVTGVSAGTTVISYAVAGCSGTVYATYTVTVTAFDGISGNVIFGSAVYGNVKVWLVKYNPTTHILSAQDSVTTYCSGTSVYYQFAGLATDSFRVKAALPDTFSTSGYMPTYHGAYFYWHDADVIYHTAGIANTGEDVTMAYGTVTTGTGFIAGDVTTGANKGTSGGGPSVHLHMCVVNSTTHQLIAQTYTDATGHYSFSNLPVGQTYYVFPDSSSYITVPYTSVSLTTASPSMSAASFVQHTLSLTITPVLAGVHNVPSAESTIFAFPNPTNGNLNITWNELAAENGAITITDLAGRVLYNTNVIMNQSTGAKQIDLSAFANGLYLVNVKSASIDYNSKVQVQH